MQLVINTSGVDLVAKSFRATARQIEVARIRALNKALRWVLTRVVRALGKEAQVVGRVIRQRARMYRASRADPAGRIWVGLQPLSAHRLGKVRQLKRGGVRVARHTFAGAFVANPSGKRDVVFSRTGAEKREASKGRYAGTGIKREPIAAEQLQMDTEENHAVIEEWYGKLNEKFMELFSRELRYEVYVKNA